jgi:hypothetical protein
MLISRFFPSDPTVAISTTVAQEQRGQAEVTSEDLPSRCLCDRRVRVLWSSPMDENSRPVLLVCGWHPERRCDLNQPIPAEKVT